MLAAVIFMRTPKNGIFKRLSKERGNMVKIILTLTLTFLLAAGLSAADKNPPYLNPKLSIDQRTNDLLSRMTLKEKVAQMCQYVGLQHQREVAKMRFGPNVNSDDAHGFYRNLSPSDVEKMVTQGLIGSFLHVVTLKEANLLQRLALKSRLQIPLLIGIDAIHGNAMVSGTTVYPTPLSLASTWQPELAAAVGRQTAREMRALGMHWSFTPNVDVARDGRWGRTGETFGEDPYLVSTMGVAMIKGLQEGNSDPLQNVIACAKHLVGGGQSINGTNAAPTDISHLTLYQIFLPSFKAAVDAGVFTIMAAHNEIDGMPCHGNRFLLTDVLRHWMGFKGFVVSDWMDIERMYNLHHVVPSVKEAYRLAVQAGVDMHMHGPGFLKDVVELVKEGKLPESRIDEAAGAILKAKFKLGLFEHRFADAKAAKKIIFNEGHQATALKAAREGIILLKNDGLLPLNSKKKLKIFVTGPNANNQTILGDWVRPQPDDHVITVLEGLQKIAGPAVTVDYFDCGQNIWKMQDEKIEQAAQRAKQADLSVLVVGSNSLRYLNDLKTSGENVDRAHLNLAGKQLQLVKKVAASGKPFVVIYVDSRPLAEPWISEHANAIIEAWEPGCFGGQAIAEVLFGKVNPSGKLPISIPRNEGQLLMVYNYKPSTYFHPYYDEKTTPLYPFGYGLSYTTFKISGLKLDQDKMKTDQELTVSVSVQNTGKMAGSETVQLYLHDEVSSLTRPVKELKRFQKIFLQPGEKKEVRFTLKAHDLGFYNGKGDYLIEPGWFTVMVGNSSRDSDLLKARFELVR